MDHPLALELIKADDKVAFIDYYGDALASTAPCPEITSRLFRFKHCSTVLDTLFDHDCMSNFIHVLRRTKCKFYMGGKLMRHLFEVYTVLTVNTLGERLGLSVERCPFFGSRRLNQVWSVDLIDEPDNVTGGEYEFGLVLGLNQGSQCAHILNALFLEDRGDFSAFKEEDPFGPTLMALSHLLDDEHWAARSFVYLLLTRHTDEALESVIDRYCSNNDASREKIQTDVLGQFCTMLYVREPHYRNAVLMKRQVVAFIRYLLKRGCRPFRETGTMSAYHIVHNALAYLPVPREVFPQDVNYYHVLQGMYQSLLGDMERMRTFHVLKKADVFVPEISSMVCSFL